MREFLAMTPFAAENFGPKKGNCWEVTVHVAAVAAVAVEGSLAAAAVVAAAAAVVAAAVVAAAVVGLFWP